jgi:hypothetical protein
MSRVRDTVHVETDRLKHPRAQGPVDDRIWRTAMLITGGKLVKGIAHEGRFCVTFPMESLDEGGKERVSRLMR